MRDTNAWLGRFQNTSGGTVGLAFTGMEAARRRAFRSPWRSSSRARSARRGDRSEPRSQSVLRNSLYVWGSLIGVVLRRLAVGYLGGGTLADRWRGAALLIVVIPSLGVGVLAIPLLDQHVLEAIVSWDPGPRLVRCWPRSFSSAAEHRARGGDTDCDSAPRGRDRAARAHGGRLFSVSTYRSIVGTFLTPSG